MSKRTLLGGNIGKNGVAIPLFIILKKMEDKGAKLQKQGIGIPLQILPIQGVFVKIPKILGAPHPAGIIKMEGIIGGTALHIVDLLGTPTGKGTVGEQSVGKNLAQFGAIA